MTPAKLFKKPIPARLPKAKVRSAEQLQQLSEVGLPPTSEIQPNGLPPTSEIQPNVALITRRWEANFTQPLTEEVNDVSVLNNMFLIRVLHGKVVIWADA
uniref:Uncharacterized protein n=1 Tax=Nothobranchius furzeri TaxID=105023 RepID=A0A1A8AMY4_NOTFU